jgi:hypothetical protein
MTSETVYYNRGEDKKCPVMGSKKMKTSAL